MKYLFALIGLLAFQSLLAQVTETASVDEKSTLRERYVVMKAKSQTYNDYKVVKEFVLDGVWKITMDSLNSGKAVLRETRNKVTALETELQSIKTTLLQKEASMEEITYAGTHINVLGIDFEKKMFITISAVTVIGLLVLLGALGARLKSQQATISEKSDLIDSTNNEFEDYKRKALDRQTKLSRELQNERNKLTEIKRS
ncbi:MAG: hypothetical protein HOP08_03190 [Cyclobacteriaceae bacterium]|nr:hypothetical protein [Cyclobacteriaceae bacterium]